MFMKIASLPRIIQLIFFASIMVITLGACNTQIHWVKAHSADPRFLKKEDFANTSIIYEDQSPIGKTDKSVNMPASPKFESIPEIRKIDHGFTSNQKNAIDIRATEIAKTLSIARKEAIKSKDLAVREGAIQQTLHEELSKNASYSKLSTHIKNKLENKLTHKISSRLNEGLDGINSYLLVGLICLLISVLFFLLPALSILGVLFGVLSAVFLILGLVQLLG